ncbi:MAG: biopolymer transporter ExbD [Rickettsiales bacterium]|nr:biopolymer transporter ExbD [Rickettsiales bacterium]
MAVLIERERRRTQAVNLTPLIDVVFLLIVFFMLSTTFTVSESLELGLPSDQKGAASADLNVEVFRVISDGAIVRNNERLDLQTFEQYIHAQLEESPDKNLLILSSPDVSVQQLVTVLDIVYQQGGRNVQIDHAPGSAIGGDVKFTE